MSAAAPDAQPEAAPPKKSKKKLIIMLAAALVLAGGGGGAFFYMKQKAAAAAAAAAEDDGDAPAAHDSHKDAKTKPTYVPLDTFVVNLADKDTDRFAQIGITLQVDDSHVADDMKTYMPALRNGILMILAHKSSEELLQRDGKETLAEEIMRAAALSLGIDLGDEPNAGHGKTAKTTAKEADDAAAPDEEDEDKPKKKKPKKKKKPVHNPITHVHYSNFIIQ